MNTKIKLSKRNLYDVPAKVVVIGDAYVFSDVLKEAAYKMGIEVEEVIPLFWGNQDKNDFQQRVDRVEKMGPRLEDCPAGIVEAVQDAQIILTHFCPIPEEVVNCAQSLQLVGTCRSGLEHIAVKTLKCRNIPVINIVRNARAVAEFTLGVMLCISRNIVTGHEAMRKGVWLSEYINSDFISTLKNMTVGLYGIGNVGTVLAKMLMALEIKTVAYDSWTTQKELKEKGLDVYLLSSPEELFSTADILSLHLRLTAETKGIVGRELLSRLKPTAYFINTARGQLVNEKELYDILAARKIAGAALDVFTKEPLLPNNPLQKLENVILTPHLAGDTVDSIAMSPYLLTEKIRRYLAAGYYKKNDLMK